MNPNTMTAQQIADQATTAQIISGIDRATQGLMTGTQADGWAAMIAKLNAALRIKLTPARTISAPAARRTPRHASGRAEYLGVSTDGMACYRETPTSYSPAARAYFASIAA